MKPIVEPLINKQDDQKALFWRHPNMVNKVHINDELQKTTTVNIENKGKSGGAIGGPSTAVIGNAISGQAATLVGLNADISYNELS